MKHPITKADCSLLRLWLVPFVSFFAVEIFAAAFIQQITVYAILFSLVWSALLSAVLSLLPRTPARILFFILYELFTVYAIIQTGYFQIFGKMMWLSELAYLKEGSEFAGSVFSYLPTGFVPAAVLLLICGISDFFVYPKRKPLHKRRIIYTVLSMFVLICCLPVLIHFTCQEDPQQKALGTDYYAGKSHERAYTQMFDAKQVYSMCGIYHTALRDIAVHQIAGRLPAGDETQQSVRKINSYFSERGTASTNDMTGRFAGKNVIMVLMESADDWGIREDVTPTICRLMNEGINFTNMYTPLYGSVRTFNSEFTVNTGVFSPTTGDLTFNYCTNDFSESLPNTFRRAGYDAQAFHYNDPSYYNRGIMEPAVGYQSYISYEDYADNTFSSELYEDTFVLTNEELRKQLLSPQPFFHFVISRNAHMPYQASRPAAAYALQQHPECKSLSDHDELPGFYAKMALLDDFFAELLENLEQENLLDNTVIIAFTDHYVYGMEDQEKVLELSDVPVDLMIEKTPCFIWSADMEQPITVDKTLNTSDILPTVLNLFGMQGSYSYIGQDAFNPNYDGYAIFSDGSWINDSVVYQNGQVIYEFYDGAAQQTDMSGMNQTAQDFIEISNLILQSDYYAQQH